MVWDGTLEWQIFKDFFILQVTALDTDTETTGLIDLRDNIPFMPSHYSMFVERVGVTDLVDVSLEGLDDLATSAFVIANVVGSNGADDAVVSNTDYTSATGKLSEHLFSFIRITAATVGATNVLTAVVMGRR